MKNTIRIVMVVLFLGSVAMPGFAADAPGEGVFSKLLNQLVFWMESIQEGTEGPELPCPSCDIDTTHGPDLPCPSCDIDTTHGPDLPCPTCDPDGTHSPELPLPGGKIDKDNLGPQNPCSTCEPPPGK